RRSDRLRRRIGEGAAVVQRRAREEGPRAADGRSVRGRARGASRDGDAMKKTLIAFTILAAATVITSAQVKPGATATDVATYTGADRMEKLIAGAKKEGSVSIYTSDRKSTRLNSSHT